ncbi:protein TPLATE [Tanacetum coccineum]
MWRCWRKLEYGRGGWGNMLDKGDNMGKVAFESVGRLFQEFESKRMSRLAGDKLVDSENSALESFRANVYPLVYGVKSVASGSIEAITKLSRSNSGVDWSKAERFVGVSDVVTHLASSLDPALIFEVGINMLFLADVPGGKLEWASTLIIAILTLWDRQEFLLRERVLLELLLPTYIFSILVCRCNSIDGSLNAR